MSPSRYPIPDLLQKVIPELRVVSFAFAFLCNITADNTRVLWAQLAFIDFGFGPGSEDDLHVGLGQVQSFKASTRKTSEAKNVLSSATVPKLQPIPTLAIKTETARTQPPSRWRSVVKSKSKSKRIHKMAR